VYRCRYEEGLSLDDTLISLRPNFPGLTMEKLVASEEQVQESLNPRQLWILGSRKAFVCPKEQQSSIDLADAPVNEPVDPGPSQESVLAAREQEERLRLAIAKLAKSERLLIRMRFEQGLSLSEIASLAGLGDAQRVHRRIVEVI
jgi:RNA polymerase sigma factor (sigma-70 family)